MLTTPFPFIRQGQDLTWMQWSKRNDILAVGTSKGNLMLYNDNEKKKARQTSSSPSWPPPPCAHLMEIRHPLSLPCSYVLWDVVEKAGYVS